jgi:hypothetical protein
MTKTFNLFDLVKAKTISIYKYLNKQSVRLKVYNTSGQHILKTDAFEENTIDISQFQTGLYFIELSDLNNQHKIFKFLLN